MPANVEQSKIMAQLKKKAAGSWKRARKVDPKARGGGGFPPNLKNVVAKCSEYKFDKTKPKDGKGGGDPYFTLTGIVVEPAEYAGKRASISWFLNESQYATFEDNLNAFANDLALLGKELPEDIGDVVSVLQELVDEECHFIFNSGGPRQNGRAPNLFIQGVAEGYESGAETGEEGDGDESEEEGTEEENPEAGEESAEAGSDDSGDEVAEEEAEEGADEAAEWNFDEGDGYSYNGHNCSIADPTIREKDGKVKVKMEAGPNTGKLFWVDPNAFESWVDEPKPKASKKPAGKTKPKGSKKK